MPIARSHATAVLFLCVCPLIRAQAPAPVTAGTAQTANSVGKPATIKTNVRQVVLDIVVTDEDSRPVKGLTQQDFSVFENNVPQRIIHFEAHDGASDS